MAHANGRIYIDTTTTPHKGVEIADLTGNLSLSSTSHIDIGPLRIEYDATNKALHITKKDSNDTETYGLYADGFIAAGWVQQTS